MIPQINLCDDNIANLESFLTQNNGIDYKIFNFLNDESIENLNWSGFEDNKDDFLLLLKGYQRLLRIMPKEKENSVFMLLKSGFHSALQICTKSRKEFMKSISEYIQDDYTTAEKIYSNALEKRGAILIQYMNMLQNNEPHISAARFN